MGQQRYTAGTSLKNKNKKYDDDEEEEEEEAKKQKQRRRRRWVKIGGASHCQCAGISSSTSIRFHIEFHSSFNIEL